MSGPERSDIARIREQPGVTPIREGQPGPVTTPEGRSEGKPWIGALEGAPPRDGEPAPIVQEAQRTAGVVITPGRAYGFFTDTTLCIGCKACEVACKQWNNLPAEGFHFSGTSYDNTRDLSATTWRHVHFIEQFDPVRFEEDVRPDGMKTGQEPRRTYRSGSQELLLDAPADIRPWGHYESGEQWAKPGARWLFMSDVCKHCVNAPCLEACPTGSIVRTEFDTVLVQQDVCNGCGYCVPACPFAVVEVDVHGDGKAHKCTLCYDRLKDGLEPACAKACPTDSIQFGPVDELLERAKGRVGELRERDVPAYLYGSGKTLEDDCDTGALGGLNCFFLLIDRPEVYNLPPAPKRPSTNTATGLLANGLAALAVTAATMLAFAGGREGARAAAEARRHGGLAAAGREGAAAGLRPAGAEGGAEPLARAGAGAAAEARRHGGLAAAGREGAAAGLRPAGAEGGAEPLARAGAGAAAEARRHGGLAAAGREGAAAGLRPAGAEGGAEPLEEA